MRAPVLAEHREAVERWGIRGVPAVTVGDAPPIVGAVPYGNYRAAVLAALGEPLIDPSDLPAGRILQTGTAYFA
jgi:predicted DsbA family dithiol-disulfide isomerase